MFADHCVKWKKTAETGKLTVVRFSSGFLDLWPLEVPLHLCKALSTFQKMIIQLYN